MPTTGDLPFGEALRDLMRERGLTFRGLEAMTRDVDPEQKGLNNAYLSQLANGRTKVSMRGIELVATALSLDPLYFLEYRSELVRKYFDRDRVAAGDLADRLRALSSGNLDDSAMRPLMCRLNPSDDELTPALEYLQKLVDDNAV